MVSSWESDWERRVKLRQAKVDKGDKEDPGETGYTYQTDSKKLRWAIPIRPQNSRRHARLHTREPKS